MEVQEYFEIMKTIQTHIIELLDTENDTDDESIMKLIDDHQMREDRSQLAALINLIVNISSNHHRTSDFFKKIETIFLILKDDMSHHFSNIELYDFSKNNKRILLFFFQNKIVVPDKSIASFLVCQIESNTSSQEEQKNDNALFFYPEIKEFIDDEELKEKIEKRLENLQIKYSIFDENRTIGENDNYICHLIRNDLVEEFVAYVNRTNYDLSSKIKPSIFETNNFLINHKCISLIEYSAFFGSIQIIQYLNFNKVQLTRSLWLYCIHSNNADLVHFLEDKHIGIEDYYHKIYISEAIKCHHNNIANYLINCFSRNEKEIENFIYFKGIKYYNFSFFPEFMNDNVFNFMCELNCFPILETLLKIENLYVNIKGALNVYTKKEKIDIVNLIIKHKSFFNRAFEGCTSLSQIIIPFSINFIGDFAFERCIALKQIVIPSSVKNIGNNSFEGCISLVQISIPSSIISIGKYAFSKCTSLEQILFDNHSSLLIIDDYAFEGCKALKEIRIPNSVTKIGKFAFDSCSSLRNIEIPISVEEVNGGAFLKCSSLDAISICSQSIKFGLKVFDGCSSVVLTNNMKMIPSYMFSGCSTLTKIILPSSVVLIEDHAFEKCSFLQSISIPTSVTSIGNNAFDGCSSLIEILIPSSVNQIGRSAFNGCCSLVQVLIPSISSIKNHLFAGCSSLTQISIPSSVTSIGNNAFWKCSSLNQISIPSSVTWIGNNAFLGCNSLDQITIPSSVITIGKNAFSSLTKVIKINK